MSIKEEFEELRRMKEQGLITEVIKGDPEEKEERHEIEGLNILILTSSTDSKNRKMARKNPTITKLEKHCEKENIPYYTAFVDSAYLDVDSKKGKIKIHNVTDKEGFEIDRDKTFVIARRSVLFHRYSKNLMARLERYRFCFLNEIEAIEDCEDKYRTILKLVADGLPVPKSTLVPTEDMIDIAHEKIGGKFPVVVKTLTGTQGVGVFIVNDYRSLKSTLQAMWGIGAGVELMIQEYIESKFDVRVHVLGDKIIGAMKRNVIDKDFRSNVHLGGKPEKYKITKEIADLAIEAAKALRCNWAGIDLMFDKDGNPYLIEVNASPGTDGIEEVTKKDLVKMVIDWIKDGNNWSRPSQEIGVLETLTIEGIGEVSARFDTGNSAKSISLDAQKVKEDGNMVTWVTKGVEMKAKKVKDVRIKDNDGAAEIDDRPQRPVVALDVTFDGVTYKDVLFNLNDRSHKSTTVLVNKDFMVRSGSVVNPAKIYVVTQKPKKLKKKKEEEDREEN